MRPKGKAIRGHNIKVVLVGTKVAHDLEGIVLRVGILCINLIRIRVSLVGPFMLLCRLLMYAA